MLSNPAEKHLLHHVRARAALRLGEGIDGGDEVRGNFQGDDLALFHSFIVGIKNTKSYLIRLTRVFPGNTIGAWI